jgi:UDP-N-acetylglucosamine transferase subunit ALG13
MIFVTVGEQLPFDRLIRTVDEWVGTSKKEVFAQIGRSTYTPIHISYKAFLTPEEFKEKLLTADVIVAHAGMGTIITALEMGKPILIMPRQAAFGEVRNNHQLSTARRFLDLNYATVAFDEFELKVKLDKLAEPVKCHSLVGGGGPSPLLIKTIRDFIKTR